jgi:hypothetical protein
LVLLPLLRNGRVMAATTAQKPTRKPVRKRPAPEPVPCHLCPENAATETELVIHLVEEHGGIWTSTNSFGLEDLIIPAPRMAEDDEPVEDPGWVRRLIRRTA